MKKILLTGNPNVGKSVIFSRLTGIGAVSANYPGTTVSCLEGETRFNGQTYHLTDTPGTYCLSPSSKAEEVAVEIIKSESAPLILHIIDSLNLERNLFFAMEILELGKPAIIVLNRRDIAENRGIYIDAKCLSEQLNCPVVPFVAVTGEGIKELEKAVAETETKETISAPVFGGTQEKWKKIGEISAKCQTIKHHHATFLEKLNQLFISPNIGLVFAVVIMGLSFTAVRYIGEGLLSYILEPLFDGYYIPFIAKISAILPDGFIKDILFGYWENKSMGLGIFTDGAEVAFVSVFPYIIAFYFVLGLLEDSGYIPRLSALLDRFFHRAGLHGYAGVPVLLGMGCKIAGIQACRTLETRRERILALILTLLTTACLPQSAMAVSVLSAKNIFLAPAFFATLLLFGAVSAVVLNKLVKGKAQEFFVEIPPWAVPSLKITVQKLLMRIREYLIDAVPMIFAGMLVFGLITRWGIADMAVNAAGGIVSFILGLPKETAPVIILGFLKKDVSIAMLSPFNLGAGELLTACVFLSMYLPCLASFLLILKENGIKDAVRIAGYTFLVALATGGILHIVRLMI